MEHALREALAGFRRAPLLIGLSVAMIGLSLFVMGLFGLTAHNIALVLESVEARVEVVAYLRDDASPEAARTLESELAAQPEVAHVRYVSRDEALEIARRELSDFYAIFGELDVNPLPASFEIALHPDHRTPDGVRAVADRASAYPFVEDVRFGQEWLDPVFLLRRVAGAAAAVLGAAFAAVAMVIIGAAVRMATFARREEIAIMRLVGATNMFVRGPFLLEGLFTGTLGGLLAVVLTYVVHRMLSGTVFQLQWLPDSWIILGVLAGALLGLLASALAIRRHLRMT